MRTPQLWVPFLAVLALTSCSRSDADATADRAAHQIKVAAAQAGEQLADSWITTKIQAQFFADDDIEARRITVSTRDSVVTLTGAVEHDTTRDLAVQIALMTDGVRQVNDRVTVTAPSGVPGAAATTGVASRSEASSEPDSLVTVRVQARFFEDDRVKSRRILVETQDGIVTLSGEVADEGERAQALLLARTTEGVSRVEDLLTVVPPGAASVPGDAALTTAIQAKYFVDPVVKGSPIDVTSRAGVVTLHGSLDGDAVRRQALSLAQSTPGVVQVIDRLTVTAKAR